jgi:hypothetical protein
MKKIELKLLLSIFLFSFVVLFSLPYAYAQCVGCGSQGQYYQPNGQGGSPSPYSGGGQQPQQAQQPQRTNFNVYIVPMNNNQSAQQPSHAYEGRPTQANPPWAYLKHGTETIPRDQTRYQVVAVERWSDGSVNGVRMERGPNGESIRVDRAADGSPLKAGVAYETTGELIHQWESERNERMIQEAQARGLSPNDPRVAEIELRYSRAMADFANRDREALASNANNPCPQCVLGDRLDAMINAFKGENLNVPGSFASRLVSMYSGRILDDSGRAITDARSVVARLIEKGFMMNQTGIDWAR